MRVSSVANTARMNLGPVKKNQVTLHTVDSTNSPNTFSRDYETDADEKMKSSMMTNDEVMTRVKTAAVMKRPQKKTFATLADAHCKRRQKRTGSGGGHASK